MEKKYTNRTQTEKERDAEKLARDKKLNGWLHPNTPVESTGETDKTVDFSSMYPNTKSKNRSD